MAEKTPPPLFLTEAELQKQTSVLGWRSGNKDISGSIFRTPRSSVEFPNVFQNVVKREPVRQLPFSYRSQRNTVQPKPKIAIPPDDDDPPYAPKTP
jgi:hypothetical protein